MLFALASLFAVSFLAATILPGVSEAYLLTLFYSGDYAAPLLVAVATTGNVCGAIINWWLGKYLMHFKHRKWFPVKEKELNRATKFYNKYGVWSLLLAWFPVVGDGFTLVAGVFNTSLWLFLPLVTLGKLARYSFVVYAAQQVLI